MNISLPCLVFENERSARKASFDLITEILGTITENITPQQKLNNTDDAYLLAMIDGGSAYCVPSKSERIPPFKMSFNLRKMDYLNGDHKKCYSGLVSIAGLEEDRSVREIKPYENEEALADDIKGAYKKFISQYNIINGIAHPKERENERI